MKQKDRNEGKNLKKNKHLKVTFISIERTYSLKKKRQKKKYNEWEIESRDKRQTEDTKWLKRERERHTDNIYRERKKERERERKDS